MYVCYSWLKELVNLDSDLDINDFINKMTMTGTKVETIKYFGDKLSRIVVGKILEIKKHPEADKLVITKIDVGNASDKILQIVTGAKNIFEGAIVPVALHNSCLFDGTKIKKSKLRGEVSEGMLCSIEELGYNKSQYPEAPDNGIYIFKDNNNLELGSDACEVLELRDIMIDFEITSNRPDCMSVLGIAREAAASFDKKLIYPELENLDLIPDNKNLNSSLDIEIKNNELCKRYMAQVIENIKIGPSPQWLRHRLILSGVNPVNNIVDITNYVMLETGQPLHAFDAENICDNKIIVRNAIDGEKIKTLDGIERNLDDNMLVIADNKKILALAGIMGGDSSKINDKTKKIVIEAANFDGYNIRLSSKKLNLRTDASNRFEKNIDFNLVELAMKRVIYLIKKLNCGDVSGFCFDSSKNKLNNNSTRELVLNPDKINNLLGTNISRDEMIKILNKLELKVKDNIISVPSFRNDIEGDADIAEEVLRFYGYDKIDFSLPESKTIGGRDKTRILDNKIKNILVAHGAFEIKNFSFESYKSCEKFLLDDSDKNKIIKILNPLGEEFSFMRNNSLSAMLKAISFNFNQKNSSGILFELGKIYELNNNNNNSDIDNVSNKKDFELPNEKKCLTIGAYGQKDFFDLKGIIESLFMNLKISDFDFEESNIKFMHPFRQANIFINNINKTRDHVGYLGEYFNYDKNKDYEIKTRIYLAVIDLEFIYKHAKDNIEFKHLPKFPAITRDIALIINKNISSKNLINSILEFVKKSNIDFLEEIKLFDVYEGKQIDKDKRSLAYELIFRSDKKTLKEEEVNFIMTEIISLLKNKYQAELR